MVRIPKDPSLKVVKPKDSKGPPKKSTTAWVDKNFKSIIAGLSTVVGIALIVINLFIYSEIKTEQQRKFDAIVKTVAKEGYDSGVYNTIKLFNINNTQTFDTVNKKYWIGRYWFESNIQIEYKVSTIDPNESNIMPAGIKVMATNSTSYNEVKDPELKMLDGMGLVRPVDYFKVSSPLGWRFDPFSKNIGGGGDSPIFGYHTGTDYETLPGVVVFASYNSTVLENKWLGGYGHEILIKFDGTCYGARFGHLSKSLINEGDIVKKGQAIALTGNSGKTTGPHLHYEIVKFDKDNNIIKYIDSEKIYYTKERNNISLSNT